MGPSTALAAWWSAGETRTLLGHRIFVRIAAAEGRPPLLLIHGYPTASFDWHLVWPTLAARYSLYALDMLGFGGSEKPRDARYTIPEQADLCVELLAQAGVASTHVLAHDYGDTVAQELLARVDEGRASLQSVVFLNGGLFPETHRARRIQKLLANPLLGPLLTRIMTYENFAKSMRSLWGAIPPTDADLQDFWQLIERNGGRHALARLINYMEQRRRNRARWVGALVASKVPRRLICGALDPVSGAHLAERYRELVPNPDVTLLPDVGHYPQMEAPGRVLDSYFEFRDSLGQRSGQRA